MAIVKYKTFEESQNTEWNFHPDSRYHQKLRELFQFYSRLLGYQRYPEGIFRYSSFEAASEQDMVWKVMAPSMHYGKDEKSD